MTQKVACAATNRPRTAARPFQCWCDSCLTSESSIPKQLNKGSEAPADGFVDIPTSAPSYLIVRRLSALGGPAGAKASDPVKT